MDKKMFNFENRESNIKNRERGFTLIELMIVSAMMVIVSLAIYATFNNGIKIWQKINRRLPQEDLNIFFDKFSSELRGTFKFKGINFSGKGNEVGFACLVNSPRLENHTVGMILYSFSRENGILYREEKDFSGIYKNEAAPKREVLKGLKSLQFRYYFYDNGEKRAVWQDEWVEESLPQAVSVELELESEKYIYKFVKTVRIPLGDENKK